MSSEPTARWIVPLNDGSHIVEFDHGTATGRRTIKVDGKTILHRDWMYRLVGDDNFLLGNNKFTIRVDPIPGFRYSYTLWVNGKSFKSFVQSQSKILECWCAKICDKQFKIILDKPAQTVWINGENVPVQNEFVDSGAEILFEVDGSSAVIRSCSSSERGGEINYILYIDGVEITDKGFL